MSWILGTIGSFSEEKKACVLALHTKPIFVVKTDTVYLAAGGIPSTCLYGKFSQLQNISWLGWIVVGLGMKREKDCCSFFSVDDWNSILAKPQPDLSYIDGHFVALRYSNQEIQIFTDQLGLRSFFAAKAENGVIFSTRLDWIAQATGNDEIDLEAFGPQWLAFNQISCWSPIRHIYRLGPGGRAWCTAMSFDSQETIWSPNFDLQEKEQFEDVLKSFLSPQSVPQDAISFGLSGGLDSRVLLALFSSMGKKSLKIHVFGDNLDPDVTISAAIARQLNLQHMHEQYFPQSLNELLSDLREYLAQIYVISPASAVPKCESSISSR